MAHPSRMMGPDSMRLPTSLQNLPPLMVVAALALSGAAESARAATLPPHDALRVLVVSDEVNPHALSPAELTQPGDLTALLLDPAIGLALSADPDALVEIPTDEIERATSLLTVGRSDPAAYDVLVYFAHRIPAQGADPPGRQAAFTAAVESFLRAGGGVVSFHHGSYAWPGKTAMLELVGAQANGAVPWDTVNGQDVIAVNPGHFACATGVVYDGLRRHAAPSWGIADADYPYFANVPDERYPTFTINPTARDFETIFVSDYVDGGTTHLLGFTHRDPAWEGIVVGYQPGEYQPNACDPAGPNAQVLVNAIVFAANALAPAEPRLLVGRSPGGALLSWIGGGPEWAVHASASPADVRGAAQRMTRLLEDSYFDGGSAALTFYSIESR